MQKNERRKEEVRKERRKTPGNVGFRTNTYICSHLPTSSSSFSHRVSHKLEPLISLNGHINQILSTPKPSLWKSSKVTLNSVPFSVRVGHKEGLVWAR